MIIMRDLSRKLKAVANERRLKILVLLSHGGKWTVGDLAEGIKLSFRSTSRHLAILKHAGLVSDEQDGLYVYYRIEKEHPVLKSLSNLLK